MTHFLFEEHKGLLVGRANGARYERENPSENYVTVPPAFMIVDSEGGVWTLGNKYVEHNGAYEFNVVRNDVDMDQMATKIAMEAGIVTIYGSAGRRRWSRGRGHFV